MSSDIGLPTLECANPTSQLPHDIRFVGRTIVITGGGGQFGREASVFFGRRGARIAALDIVPGGLAVTIDALSHELGAGNCDAQGFVCDCRNEAQVQSVVQAIADRFGRIDLLWNNAGYQGAFAPTLHYPIDDFTRVLEINVTGGFIVLQAVARQMVKQQEQDADKQPYAIVNTASVAGISCTPAMVAYSASKAAVLAVTSCTAKDLAPHGIRVNSISPALIGPGFMWTRQNELHAVCGSPYFATDPDQVAIDKLKGVPMLRLGSVEEVVKGVAFLLSEDSSYMTGANLVVDGGVSSGLKG